MTGYVIQNPKPYNIFNCNFTHDRVTATTTCMIEYIIVRSDQLYKLLKM